MDLLTRFNLFISIRRTAINGLGLTVSLETTQNPTREYNRKLSKDPRAFGFCGEFRWRRRHGIPLFGRKSWNGIGASIRTNG